MPIDPTLLSLLACPRCHGTLLRVESPDGFACEACRLFFAVEDDVPNFLLEDARPWPAGDAKAGA